MNTPSFVELYDQTISEALASITIETQKVKNTLECLSNDALDAFKESGDLALAQHQAMELVAIASWIQKTIAKGVRK